MGMKMANAPSKKDSLSAARAFIKFWDSGNRWTQADFLMRLGRLYEFSADTPKYDGPWSAAAISAFIQDHAREIE
jgi:hypothetical protein